MFTRTENRADATDSFSYRDWMVYYQWSIASVGPLGMVVLLFLVLFPLISLAPNFYDLFLDLHYLLGSVWLVCTISLVLLTRKLNVETKSGFVVSFTTLKWLNLVLILVPVFGIPLMGMEMSRQLPIHLILKILRLFLAWYAIAMFPSLGVGFMMISKKLKKQASNYDAK